MTPLISLKPGFASAAESATGLPADAQAPQEGIADLLFMPLESQPAPQPQWLGPAAAADTLPVPAETVVDPQQWLNAMLNQQAVQLQARGYSDVLADSSDATPELDRLAARMPVPVLLNAVPEIQRLQPRRPLPGGAVVVGQEVFNPSEHKLVADKEWQGAPQVFVQPSKSRVAGLSSAWQHVGPAPQAVATVLTTATGAPAVNANDGVALTPPVTSPAALLPGSAAAQGPALESSLKLAAPQARWGEQMLHALRETVQVQVQQRFQQATIRLDPPELGSLEIFISHEPGRLNVQISAVQGEVARLLLHTSDRLRQELVEQNTLQVSVEVSSAGQGRSGGDSSRQRHEAQIAEAIEDALGERQSKKHSPSDVLVTV